MIIVSGRLQRGGGNEDRSGCYLSLSLSLWAPLETWPMAPAVLESLTSAG